MTRPNRDPRHTWAERWERVMTAAFVVVVLLIAAGAFEG